jgi:hypothetical protein
MHSKQKGLADPAKSGTESFIQNLSFSGRALINRA